MSRSDGQSGRVSFYTIDEISQIVSPIAQRFGVKRIWLFGSYARGEATPDSDLDFRVELGEPYSFMKDFGFTIVLGDAFDVKIHLISSEPLLGRVLDKKFLEQISHDEVLLYEHIA